MKTCKSCNKTLGKELFSKSKVTKDGYENKCKKCRVEQRKKYINTCITCSNEFKTAYKKSKYCSTICKPQCIKKRIKVKYSYCNKEKEITLSRSKMYKNFYCSDTCKNNHYRILYVGENNPKYTRKTLNCAICNKKITRNIHEISKYEKHYCSQKCKQKDYINRFSGKNNPMYNPNKTDEERIQNRNIDGYNEWVRQVYSRDSYTCQCCGDNKGGNLNAHHILNYMEHKTLRIDANNGITLCKSCHRDFHKKYGYKNNTREQLKEFLDKYDNTEPSQEGNHWKV